MRQEGADDWTTVEPSAADTESFVQVPLPVASPNVLKLSFAPKHESVGVKSTTTWTSACVSIEACDMPEDSGDRTSSVDICVALDVSGSMRGSKLRDCKSTLEAMLRPLSAKDRFGLITFGNRCNVVFPALLMTKENKAAALKKIKALFAGGGTNLSGGLSLAWQELLLAENPNPVRSLFLLTDGLANQGLRSTPELVQMVQSFNADSPSDIAAALNQNQAGAQPPDVIFAKRLEDLRKMVELRPFSFPFHHPVDRQAIPRYYEVISNPIDLSTIRHKIKNNEYRTTEGFLKDFQLMKTNAIQFNGAENIIAKVAVRIFEFVKSKIEERRGEFADLEAKVAAAPPSRKRIRLSRASAAPVSSSAVIPRTITLTSKGAPVSLFCFGYGSDHNSEMLEAISEATPGGGYYFVENDSDVFTAFGDAMGGIMSVMAQSAVLKISVPPAAAEAGVKIREVHHDTKVDRGDGSFTVNLDDFYAEERRDVVVDFDLANVTSNEPVLHLISTLSYMNVLTKKNTTGGPRDCSISRPDSADLSAVNKEVEAQCLRVQVVREMEEADREARSNNRAQARARLGRMQASILQASAAFGAGDAFYSSLQQNVSIAMEDYAQADRDRCSSYKGHRSKNVAQALRKQRARSSKADSGPSGDYYQTSRKKRMAEAFQRKSG